MPKAEARRGRVGPADPVVRAGAEAALRAGLPARQVARDAGVSSTTVRRWQRMMGHDLGASGAVTALHAALRMWARGSHAREAGIELLIRCGVATTGEAEWILIENGLVAGIDTQELLQAVRDWRSEQRCLVEIAVSLLGGPPVDLATSLPIDRGDLALVLAAIAHAAGSHQHTTIARDETGKLIGFRTLPPLHPWPDRDAKPLTGDY